MRRSFALKGVYLVGQDKGVVSRGHFLTLTAYRYVKRSVDYVDKLVIAVEMGRKFVIYVGEGVVIII